MKEWPIVIVLCLFAAWMLAGNSRAAIVTSVNQGQFSAYTSTHKALVPCVDIMDGSPGTQGPRGYTGYSGASGTMEVGTVTTLAAGSNATFTNVGTPSAAVWNIGIPRGYDGDINNITQALIEGKIALQGGKLYKRALAADSEVLFELARLAGDTSLFITANGLLVVQNPAGTRLWSFEPVGSAMVVKSSSGRVIFSATSSASSGGAMSQSEIETTLAQPGGRLIKKGATDSAIMIDVRNTSDSTVHYVGSDGSIVSIAKGSLNPTFAYYPTGSTRLIIRNSSGRNLFTINSTASGAQVVF